MRVRVRVRMCPAYVAGLIGAGDRKSIQPMAARDGGVGYDRLHHFIISGAWGAAPLEQVLLTEACGGRTALRIAGADCRGMQPSELIEVTMN